MPKEPVIKSTGILRIPFGSPLTGPKKRFEKDLQEISFECDKARNAIFDAWTIWHRLHPDFQPGQVTRHSHKCPNCGKVVTIRKDRKVGQMANCTIRSCKAKFQIKDIIVNEI